MSEAKTDILRMHDEVEIEFKNGARRKVIFIGENKIYVQAIDLDKVVYIMFSEIKTITKIKNIHGV